MHKLSHFLQAYSVAVIGASDDPKKVGHQIFRNLVKNNAEPPHAKKFYPINPHLKSLLGVPAFASILDIKQQIDVVVIVTPATTVSALVDEIIERNKTITDGNKVHGIVIISAGFAETSPEGKKLQSEVVQKLAAVNISLIGPNSLGYVNPVDHINASFAQTEVPAGNIGLISQSGAMLTALFDVIASSDLGVSFAISLGNKGDINENDGLEYAANDPFTRVIALYLESFSDLPHFFELASKISKKKPIIVLKGGTSQRGQAASLSHTAALATNQVLLTEAAKQMGFVLVNTIEELVNTVFFLSRHHYLIQNTVIITNAGGPAVNTIDRLAAENVSLAQWSRTSLNDFQRLLPQVAIHNPLDLLGDATAERYKYAIQVAQRDQEIDSMLVIITPQAVTDIPAIVDQIIELKGKKPVLVSLMGGDQLEKYRSALRTAGISCAAFPNDLVNILQYTKQVTDYHFQTPRFVASAIHSATDHTEQKELSLENTFELLKEEGFQIPKYQIINKKNFTELRSESYPLFAKTANLALLHKKQVGAVIGAVDSYSKAAKAYHQLLAFGEDVLFQEIVPIDHEVLLGIENDPQFGLYMTIGLGGSQANVIADRAYVFLPALKFELKTAWQKTKAYQSISDPKIATKMMNQMVMLQKLVMKHSWIKSIELNPLIINSEGVWVVDVKITQFSSGAERSVAK